MNNRLSLAFTLLLIPIAYSASSFSQELTENATPDEQEDERIIEEVLVTANFRSESIQDVAGSIASFNQDRARELAASDIGDLAKFTPSLSNNDRGPGRNDMNIRGMGRLAVFSDAVPTTNPVGMYLDDISVNTATSSQADIDFFGIERIEVLRGPQGTLYGESAEGGAVRFISREPDFEGFSGVVEVEGNDGHSAELERSERILLNLPVDDERVAVVFSANHTRQSGYIDNVTENTDNINELKKRNYRGTILANLSGRFSVKVTAYKNLLEYGAFNLIDAGEEPEPKSSFKTSDDFNKEEFVLVPIKAIYALDSFSLEYIYGYYNRDIHSRVYNGYAAIFASAITAPQGYMADGHVNTKYFWTQRSQEFRYISNWQNPFGLIAGIYYRTSEYDTDGVGYSKDVPNLEIFSGGSVYQETDQTSYYAEFTWDISDAWSMTVGMRRHDETLYTDGEALSLFSPNPSGELLNTGIESPISTGPIELISLPGLIHEFELSENLPMLRVHYQPSEDSLYYFRYATGLRSGNTNVPLTLFLYALGSGDPSSFGPDNPYNHYRNDYVASYELGAKNTFWDGRWVLNTALFYNDWDDLQVLVIRNGSGLTTNVGKARSIGLEVESVMYLPDNWQWFFAASLIDAEITEGFVSGTDDNDMVEEGARIPFVQKNAFSSGVAYNHVFGNGVTLRPMLSYSYTGKYKQFLESQNFPYDSSAGGYGLFNFSLNVGTDRWQANFSVSNLFNKAVFINVTPTTANFEAIFRFPAPENIDEAYMNSPRSMKLTLGLNF